MFRAIFTFFLLLWLSNSLWAIDAIRYTVDDDTQIDFIWREATGNPHHYNVYVSVDEEEYIREKRTTKTNSYTVMGENGRSYRVKVEAEDANGNVGPMSEESDLVICQISTSFTSYLSAGVNMMAVPLKPNKEWQLSDLISHIGPDLSVIIFYDTSAEKFVDYIPGFSPTAQANVPIDERSESAKLLFTAGKGYIVVMQKTADVTFEGTAWDGDVKLAEGINLLSVPLHPESEWHLNDLAEHIGPEVRSLFWYDKEKKRFVGYSLDLKGSFADSLRSSPQNTSSFLNTVVKGDESYIAVMEVEKRVTFTGKAWENEATASLSIPPFHQNVTPILIVEGLVKRANTNMNGGRYSPKPPSKRMTLNGPDSRDGFAEMQVWVRNLSSQQDTNSATGTVIDDGRYVVTLMDFFRNSAGQIGDVLEVTVLDPTGTYSVESIRHSISASEIKAGMVLLSDIHMRMPPKQSALLQNYPNPFNPETWIPYQLSSASEVTIQIYDIAGHLVRTLLLGNQPAGYYQKKHRATYWDGRNENGEQIASGVYFYTLKAGLFHATRKFTLLK